MIDRWVLLDLLCYGLIALAVGLAFGYVLAMA